MNETNPREKLAFVEVVTEFFRFLETEYGYRQTHRDPTCVEYKSGNLEIHVMHDLHSYEVELSITGGHAWQNQRFSLPEILGGLAPDYPDKGFYQTTNKDLLRESVADIAGLIRKYADALLRGSADAVHLVEMAVREEAERMFERHTIEPMKAEADAAWKRKDYAEVIALYTSIESYLNSLEKRRLDYAKSHREGN